MNRRMLLSSGLATIAFCAPAMALNVIDRSQFLRTYARLRGGKDGALALWWYTGNVWGKTADDVARIMFTVQGLTFQRVTSKPDGSLEQRMAGRGWYGDAGTGKPLDTWTNPITGEKIEPPHIRSLTLQTISPQGQLASPDAERLALFNGQVGGLAVNGDTLWMTENFVGKSKPDLARNGAVTTSASLSTFTARVAEVENDAADFVPCQLNYQNLGSWPAWMKMPQPGTLSWQTYGHKVRGADAAPKELRDWIEARFPGFLENPGI